MDARITLRVDGEERPLTVDTRTTLLDALREHLGVTRPKKGCDHGQCGACTVLLDGRRVTTCLALAVAHDGAEITTAAGLGARRRAAPDAAGLPRPRRLPVRLLHARARSARPSACSTRSRPGWPSHVTADLADRRPSSTDAEIRERMSGNLCRCGAYANIVAAIQRARAAMKPFDYEPRATERRSDAVAAVAERPDGGLPRRRHQPRRPHEARRRRPGPARRRHAACRSTRHRAAARRRRCGSAPTSATATSPPTRSSAALSGARPGAARRRLRPAAQPRHHRRQPAAAHPLRLLPGRHHPVQQARARQPAARAIDGYARYHAILGASEHCVAAHPSDMAVALAALDAVVDVEAPTASAASPLADLHRLPGDEPDRDTMLRARRADHRRRAAAARRSPPARAYRKVRDRASYAFALVSVAAALDVARRRASATCASRSAASRTSRGGRARAEDAAARRPGRPRTRSGAAADAELAGAQPLRGQRVQGADWPATPIVATLRDLAGGTQR